MLVIKDIIKLYVYLFYISFVELWVSHCTRYSSCICDLTFSSWTFLNIKPWLRNNDVIFLTSDTNAKEDLCHSIQLIKMYKHHKKAKMV